ncbi:MAG: transcription elongation factor GreA [Candidatus Omnitrophica bacterium]|nr:transcription elongation factor GreA [Candidatus Omnitrophota bacterium]MDD5671762.1 transcription elongation factor GreA [Candidatus Omnitrophota bacterium]
MEKVILTRDGYEKLMEELKFLKTTKRKEVAKQLETARAHGDLSENAEYDAAKEAKQHLETRIAQLELKLSNARIVDPGEIPQDKAFLGVKVEVKNLNTGDLLQLTLVTQDEADFAQGKISITSPIGKGLLGKGPGEKAEIQIPAGKVTYEILRIIRG